MVKNAGLTGISGSPSCRRLAQHRPPDCTWPPPATFWVCAGDKVSPLKLGKTYLGLFVEAQNQPAYLWLSISQAYGDVAASELLDVAANQLTLEEVLSQQEQAQKIFDEIIFDD